MKLLKIFYTFCFLLLGFEAWAGPLISGISSNEINVDTEFKGAQIL
jgi:hypothetical protein